MSNIWRELVQMRMQHYIILFILSSVLILNTITTGEFTNCDAVAHAMDGVYYLDILQDRPSNIVSYTEGYGVRYPSLGLVWYPPFFAFTEVPMYFIFGVSVFTARLTIYIYYILFTLVLYKLLKILTLREDIAFFTTFLTISSPFFVLFGKTIMLEIPVVLLSILAIYFFYSYFELSNERHLYYLGLTILFGLLTKYSFIVLLPAFISYLYVRKKLSLLHDKKVIVTMIASLGLAVPNYFILFKYGSVFFSQIGTFNPSHVSRFSFENWFFYIKQIFIVQTTLIVAIICFIGVLYAIYVMYKKNLTPGYVLLMLCIFWIYILFSLVSTKTPRYTLLLVPLLICMGISFLYQIENKYNIKPFIVLSLILICASQFYVGYNTSPNIYMGYDSAAKYVVSNCNNGTILFNGDGVETGNFIFDVKKYDENKSMIVLRGNLQLLRFSGILDKKEDIKELIVDENDISKLLKDYNIEYVVYLPSWHEEFKSYQLLKKALDNETQFNLEKNIIVYNKGKEKELRIYKNKHPRQSPNKQITIYVRQLGRNITLGDFPR